MLPRAVAGVLIGGAAMLAGGAAAAQGAPAPPVTRRGAIVVAVGGDEATAAAPPLARAVYQDAELRPTIADGAARALIGEKPPAPAASGEASAEAPAAPPAVEPSLREIADTRAAIAAGSDAAARRLLASLGTDAHAEAVVAVTVREGRPVARVLRLPAGTFEPVEIVGSVEPERDPLSPSADPATFTWPGAVDAIRGMVTGWRPRATPPPALAPKAHAAKPAAESKPRPSDPLPMVASPWFWGGLAAVATVGVTVFVVSKSSASDDPMVRVQGRVPQ